MENKPDREHTALKRSERESGNKRNEGEREESKRKESRRKEDEREESRRMESRQEEDERKESRREKKELEHGRREHNNLECSNLEHGSLERSNPEHNSLKCSSLECGNLERSTPEHENLKRGRLERDRLKRGRLEPYLHPELIEAGCDEAGRGCLAGPVFAAAVILPKDFYHPLLNDSKQLTAKQREKLRPIIEQQAIAWSVVAVSAQEIDELNILRASITAMHRAVAGLSTRPQSLLIDGNRFYKYEDIPHTCIVKGDSKYASIAAASILAKTHRDEYMLKLAAEYPQYGWEKNMAYPTKQHRQAIAEFGATPHHRMSFKLIDDEPTLF